MAQGGQVKMVQQSFLAVCATNTLRAASATCYAGLQHAVNGEVESPKRVCRKVVIASPSMTE